MPQPEGPLHITTLCGAFVDVFVNVTQEELASTAETLGIEHLQEGGAALVNAQQAQKAKALFEGRLSYMPGGSGANSIAIAAALGARGAFVGKVATDILGKRFVVSLQEKGLQCAHSMWAPNKATASPTAQTGHVLAMLTPGGERTMLVHPGVSDAVNTEDVSANAAWFSEAPVCFLSVGFHRYVPRTTLHMAAELAQAGGATIALSLQCFEGITPHEQACVPDILKYATLLFGNQAEFAACVQCTPAENIAQLSAQHPGTTFVETRSSAGARIYINGQCTEVPAVAVPPAKVKDLTGAGDAFAGAYMYAHALGMPPAQCGALAVRCGAAMVQEAGGRLQGGAGVWAHLMKGLGADT